MADAGTDLLGRDLAGVEPWDGFETWDGFEWGSEHDGLLRR
jgi:hypothetical protein